jgi:DNA-binding MarR family transcriptional regulator
MPDATSERVTAAIVTRRNRDRLLPDRFFSDPAWDALLELYAADAQGDIIALPELAERLGVTESLALRWTDILETVGLLVREEDAIAISQEGRRKIETIFS